MPKFLDETPGSGTGPRFLDVENQDPRAAMRVANLEKKILGSIPTDVPQADNAAALEQVHQLEASRKAFRNRPLLQRAKEGSQRQVEATLQGIRGLFPGTTEGLNDPATLQQSAINSAIQSGDRGAEMGAIASDVGISALPIAKGAQLATQGVTKGGQLLVRHGAPRIGALVQAVAPVLGDTAAVAAYSGAVAPEGEKLEAMKEGAKYGAGGSVLTRTMARAVNPGVLQVTPEARRMMSRGVQLTPGYMSPEGSFVRSMEERLQAMPIVGPVIRDARINAIGSWNGADVRRVMGGRNFGSGSSAVTRAVEEVQDTYNRIFDGRVFKPDAQFQADVARIRATHLDPKTSTLLPDQQARLNQLLNTLDNQMGFTPGTPPTPSTIVGPNGQPAFTNPGTPPTYNGVAGESWKGGIEKPLRDAEQAAWNAASTELGGAVNETRDAVRGLRDRSLGPGGVGMVAENDARYAELTRRERAANSTAAARQSGVYTPQQLDTASYVGDKGVNKRGYQRGTAPGTAAADEGLSVFGNSIPPVGPGTAEKLMAAGLLSGTAGAAGELVTGNPVQAGKWALMGLGVPYAAKLAYTNPGILKYASGTLRGQAALANALRRLAPVVAREGEVYANEENP